MSIIISPNLVLPGDDGLTLNHPLILPRNRSIVTAATISADSAAAGYPASNLATPQTYRKWLSDSSATQYLTISPDEAKESDTVGLCRHNLHTAEVAAEIEGDIGAGFVSLTDPFMPGDGRPLIFRYERRHYAAIRIKLYAGTTEPEIAIVYCGRAIVSQRTLYKRHPIPTFARKSKSIAGASESGEYLGSIETEEFLAAKIPFSLIEPAFYREHIDDFFSEARKQPFFFGWRPTEYPDETGYFWLTADPEPVNDEQSGLVAFDLDMAGVIA